MNENVPASTRVGGVKVAIVNLRFKVLLSLSAKQTAKHKSSEDLRSLEDLLLSSWKSQFGCPGIYQTTSFPTF
jgi:hypothetical protein